MRALDDGVPGGVRTSAGAAPAAQRAEAVARFSSMTVALVALGVFATLYGFLEPGRSHPSLKLGGAMAIAGMGVASLTLGRPVEPRAAKFPYRYRSALVEVHPLVL